jgi:hypothetical protein
MVRYSGDEAIVATSERKSHSSQAASEQPSSSTRPTSNIASARRGAPEISRGDHLCSVDTDSRVSAPDDSTKSVRHKFSSPLGPSFLHVAAALDLTDLILCEILQGIPTEGDTFYLVHQHSLLHRDRDFDPFEDVLGLQVVHP